MEENRISKTHHIEIRINPETKAAFLSKLSEVNISTYQPFLAWLLDKWVKAENEGRNAVSLNTRHIISLMPRQIVPRGFKFKDAIFCARHKDGKKSYQWVVFLRKTAVNSPYQSITNVARCLIYAIILAPLSLLKQLVTEMVGDKIGGLDFRYRRFQTYISKPIYDLIREKYNISPATVIRRILDVLLASENTDIKNLILHNINPNPPKMYDKRGTYIGMDVRNDFYRLKVYEFMYELGVKSRPQLIYSLLDVALKIPQIISPVQVRQGADEDAYKEDMYEKMAAKYYQYTGL